MADIKTEINPEDLEELNSILSDMGGIDKVEDYTNQYEQLADGDYLGEICDVSAKNSKNSGKPMIDIVVALEGGRKEHTCLMLAGDNLQKTQSAVARTITQLKKLNVTGTEVSDFVHGSFALVGTRVNLHVSTRNGFTAKEITLA